MVIVGTFLGLTFTFPLGLRPFQTQALWPRPHHDVNLLHHALLAGGLIPNFVLVEKLRLLDSFWAMIWPVLINPWWLLIMRNFMLAIPEELEEAAIMDGASPLVVLIRVYLPLSMPVIATIGLWYAVYSLELNGLTRQST